MLGEDGDIHMAVPTRFMRDWVANHYSERLREIWRLENPTVRRVVIHVRPTGATQPPQTKSVSAADETVLAVQPARPVPVEATPQSMPPARELDDGEREISAPLDPRFTFATFITGQSKELDRPAPLPVAATPPRTQH